MWVVFFSLWDQIFLEEKRIKFISEILSIFSFNTCLLIRLSYEVIISYSYLFMTEFFYFSASDDLGSRFPSMYKQAFRENLFVFLFSVYGFESF